ncbi:MAG TPA: hypothetical protein VFX16_10430, partial [Pseudonocardiaceae bacterium]|nr:hypothetical protein [Pseudonocardiaceae bacterium]
VSLNTSWRFFGERLGVTGGERIIMFSVQELALIACALGMRINVRRVDPGTGRPGSAGAPRLVAWALCGLSGYAALLLSGPVDGIARVALGPILSLVMLHLALGIEIRNHTGVRTGTWARIGVELRERALSRLGLADDNRDAVTRTRERAASRAARLAVANRATWRTARALRAAGVAHDPVARERLLAEVAVLRSVDELTTLPLPSPWQPAEPEPVLDPPASEDTIAGGMLDGVVLLAHADDIATPWTSISPKYAAVDQADTLLPGRTPRELVAALSQVGVSVAESTVRRRRSQRDRVLVTAHRQS